MEYVKKLFMGDDVAYQLHLPATKHINVHPFVLHTMVSRHPAAAVGLRLNHHHFVVCKSRSLRAAGH